MFYLQNRDAGYLGNSPMFWAIRGGYTQWIDDAKRFTQAEVDEIVSSCGRSMICGEKFKAWPCDLIDSKSRRTVDMQDIH